MNTLPAITPTTLTISSIQSAPVDHASPARARCPFHDGAATLDLLLAELNPRERELFDAALDLRSLAAAGTDARACFEQLFRVRALLGGRHYLAFYRVRCWAKRALRIEVCAQRGAAWLACELPVDGARVDEVVNASLASLANTSDVIPAARVRIVFAAAI